MPDTPAEHHRAAFQRVRKGRRFVLAAFMAYFRPILLGLQTIVPLHLVEKLLAHYPHADLQSCATRHIRVSCNGADAGRYLCSEIHFVTETIPTRTVSP